MRQVDYVVAGSHFITFSKRKKYSPPRSIASLFARFGMMRIVKFHDMETALAHIEVDIALFKIRGVRLPDFCLRVFCFDHPPHCLSDPTAVTVRIDVKQIQLIALGVRMDIDDNAADRLAVSDDPKRLREFPVKALFYRLSINDAFLLRAEFLYRRLVESRLIFPDKNLLFGFIQRS